MAKHYSVTPVQHHGRTVYSAVFRLASGERVCRSLGTADHATAALICAGLVRLRNAGVADAAAVPVDVPERAVALYFGAGRTQTLQAGDLSEYLQEAMREGPALLALAPNEALARVIDLLVSEKHLTRETANQRTEIFRLKAERDAAVEQRRALANSVQGRLVDASRRVPEMSVALEAFTVFFRSKNSEAHAKDVLRGVAAFLATLPATVKPHEVTPHAIGAWIDAKAAAGDAHYKVSRRRHWRTLLGTFFNWAARQWEYPSQMSGVETVSRAAALREKGEIQWHALGEVQSAIAGLPDTYWKALVGTLAYAGLRLAEVLWLRRADLIELPSGRAQLNVTTVEDEDGEKHLLKTAHSHRLVNVHARRLRPLLEAHLAAGGANDAWLFPIPAGTRNAGRRWGRDSLSTRLRGHRGGKYRKATAALLPAGMNAKSLRRTFGSLLLRDGATTAQVAAAMGNTESVVSEHYALLLGREVKINF
jgi:hypothetical protein